MPFLHRRKIGQLERGGRIWYWKTITLLFICMFQIYKKVEKVAFLYWFCLTKFMISTSHHHNLKEKHWKSRNFKVTINQCIREIIMFIRLSLPTSTDPGIQWVDINLLDPWLQLIGILSSVYWVQVNRVTSYPEQTQGYLGQ